MVVVVLLALVNNDCSHGNMAVSSESARGRLADCSGFGNICLYCHHTETGLTMQTMFVKPDPGLTQVLGQFWVLKAPEDLVLDN